MMTVAELRQVLEGLERAGHGAAEVCIVSGAVLLSFEVRMNEDSDVLLLDPEG